VIAEAPKVVEEEVKGMAVIPPPPRAEEIQPGGDKEGAGEVEVMGKLEVLYRQEQEYEREDLVEGEEVRAGV